MVYGGLAQSPPTIGQCLNGGLGCLEIERNRRKTRASLPLDVICRRQDAPLWKLQASFKCRSCRNAGYILPVHMIRLMAMREVTPYKWGHLNKER
jgi:hypothetical protein